MKIEITEDVLNEVNELINSGKLTNWLVNNTTNVETSLFIFQSILNTIEELKQ